MNGVMILNPKNDLKNFIINLSRDETYLILQKLFVENPSLEKLIQKTAIKVVSNVDGEIVANSLHDDLVSLELEELFSRSGSNSYGYVDPHDESWVMFEEAVEPFIREMKKFHQREMPHVTKEYCIGIIKGLVKFSMADTEFLEWIAEAPLEHISYVVDEYRKLQPDENDVKEVEKIVAELDELNYQCTK